MEEIICRWKRCNVLADATREHDDWGKMHDIRSSSLPHATTFLSWWWWWWWWWHLISHIRLVLVYGCPSVTLVLGEDALNLMCKTRDPLVVWWISPGVHGCTWLSPLTCRKWQKLSTARMLWSFKAHRGWLENHRWTWMIQSFSSDGAQISKWPLRMLQCRHWLAPKSAVVRDRLIYTNTLDV